MLSSYQIFQFLYLLLPIAVVTFFTVSLVRYFTAKNKNKKAPGSYTAEEMNARKLSLVFSSIILGIILFSVLCLFGLLMMAVSYM
ncbi:MAG: hypothetical protein IJZ89_01820 [Clostridia bacterium]|nr:hypothetical protein [Clostridia bacterium]